MTPTQEALARRLVAHQRWEWRTGMRAIGRRREPRAWFRLEENVKRLHGEWADACPDLTDAATAGVLSAMLREASLTGTDIFWGEVVEVVCWHGSSQSANVSSPVLCVALAEALLEVWDDLTDEKYARPGDLPQPPSEAEETYAVYARIKKEASDAE